jgi:hypothetical protein
VRSPPRPGAARSCPVHAANRACVNSLGQALDLCDAMGVAVDVYHTRWDPDLQIRSSELGPHGCTRFMFVTGLWLPEIR